MIKLKATDSTLAEGSTFVPQDVSNKCPVPATPATPDPTCIADCPVGSARLPAPAKECTCPQTTCDAKITCDCGTSAAAKAKQADAVQKAAAKLLETKNEQLAEEQAQETAAIVAPLASVLFISLVVNVVSIFKLTKGRKFEGKGGNDLELSSAPVPSGRM